MKITNEYHGITCTYNDVTKEAVSSHLSSLPSKFATYCKLRCKGAGKEWKEKLNFEFSLEEQSNDCFHSSVQVDFSEKSFSICVLKTSLKHLDPRDISAFLFSMWLSNQILSLKECLYSQTPLIEEDLLDGMILGGTE